MQGPHERVQPADRQHNACRGEQTPLHQIAPRNFSMGQSGSDFSAILAGIFRIPQASWIRMFIQPDAFFFL
jgi:hypothetical protein